MSYICSECLTQPEPTASPGTWHCDCILDPVKRKTGLWNKDNKFPTLIPDKETAATLSPVTDNPDEDTFYDGVDRSGK